MGFPSPCCAAKKSGPSRGPLFFGEAATWIEFDAPLPPGTHVSLPLMQPVVLHTWRFFLAAGGKQLSFPVCPGERWLSLC